MSNGLENLVTLKAQLSAPDPKVEAALRAAKPNLKEGSVLAQAPTRNSSPYNPTKLLYNDKNQQKGRGGILTIGATGAEITSVTTLEPEDSATASVTLNGHVLEFEFGLPRGETGGATAVPGPPGQAGPMGAAPLSMALVTSTMGREILEPGGYIFETSPQVWRLGLYYLPSPTGPQGPQGLQGATGPTGEPG